MADIPPPGAPGAANGAVRRGRMSLSLAFGLAIGGLLILSVGGMLVLSLWGAGTNTRSLLSDKADLILQTAVNEVRGELDPAAATATFVANELADGTIPLDDPAAIATALRIAHAGLDQAAGIVFIRQGGSAVGVRRLPDGSLAAGEFDIETLQFAGLFDRLAQRPGQPMWGAPTWSYELETSVLNVARGVVVDGELVGVVGVAVSVREFSAILGRLGDSLGQHAFALLDHDFVLAHPLMAGDYPGLSADHPLPRVTEFEDPVLAHIWDGAVDETIDIIDFRPGAAGHPVEIGEQTYIFVYQILPGYADKLIQVGAYFPSEQVGSEVKRLIEMLVIGIAIILVAVLMSFLVARKLARPFVRVAAAANQVGEMALERIEDLPASRIREIDDQARAFNGMVRALRWLEIYVPRRLARRLLETTGGTVSSQDAEVSVMFTDIVGFTTWSEDRDAPAVADFLNHHFAIVGRGIEATGGTIDKFIGDGAMAFWGAPERQEDHALRAVRAARLIAQAVAAENEARDAGAAPLRMRIGIHCGRVTVGNIGAPDRMNYTIVGDTVNVCQRLEQVGKDVLALEAGEAVVIVVSEAVAHQLPKAEQAALRPIGAIALRGRAEPIKAFRLDGAGSTP